MAISTRYAILGILMHLGRSLAGAVEADKVEAEIQACASQAEDLQRMEEQLLDFTSH